MLLAILAYLIWILLILGGLGLGRRRWRLGRPRPVQVRVRSDE